MTRKLLYTIALTIGLIVFFSAPVALSQSSTPHTRPPILPQDQAPLPDRPGQGNPEQGIQDRVAPFPPDQSQPVATSPAPATSTLADSQARVQEALQRDMPGSGIQVSVTDNGSLQLTGSVPTSDQKRRAEDIARSTTNNQSIVNRIAVTGEQAPGQTAVPR
jgi:hypothetical protein